MSFSNVNTSAAHGHVKNGKPIVKEVPSGYVRTEILIPPRKRALLDVIDSENVNNGSIKCSTQSHMKKPFSRIGQEHSTRTVLGEIEARSTMTDSSFERTFNENYVSARRCRRDTIPLLSPISDKTHDSELKNAEVEEDIYIRTVKSPAIFKENISASSVKGSVQIMESDYRLPEGVIDIDSADFGNHLTECEFADIIQRNLLKKESDFVVDEKYMDRQLEISEKMRAILVDWLVDVHRKFDLSHETLHLSINIIDRFLETSPVSRCKLQLVGVAATFLSSKYEEIYAPVTSDFVYITDRAYTEKNVLEMEAIILNRLKFSVTVPSPLRFLHRNCKALRVLYGDRTAVAGHLAHYCVDLALQDISMLKYRHSERAAAAVLLSLKIHCKDISWDASMQYYSGNWSAEALEPCERHMYGLLKNEQDPKKINKLTAIKRKFSSTTYSSVAKLAIPAARNAP